MKGISKQSANLQIDYAMIGGQRYSVKFAGYDRATYRHLEGCLAFSPMYPAGEPGQACQCGAAERATKVYTVEVAPANAGAEKKV